MLNEDNAKLIKIEETYPNRANSPTYIRTYECACGKGTVEHVNVPGFNDYYTNINCEECSKKYKIQTGCGHIWEFVDI